MDVLESIEKRFEQFGFPLYDDNNIIPEDDDSTLFICSGMQKLKSRFKEGDGSLYGSIQSCIRTNDLDLVGDGQHLTFFRMIGNFSFKGIEYAKSVEMWTAILTDLYLNNNCYVHVHPSRGDHMNLWLKNGFVVVSDRDCEWSDGDIGGHCCEIHYRNKIEIGNLVNPLNHSTDVGFGLERLVQAVENQDRVDTTTLFNRDLHPIVRDHVRTLRIMKENKIIPGNKGREYVCRRLLRRLMRYQSIVEFKDWIKEEQELLDKRFEHAKRVYPRHKDKSADFWWDTFGILPEELEILNK